MHDLGTGFLLAAARQPAVAFVADRIGQRFVGKWKLVAGRIVSLDGGGETAGHGEFKIGKSPARGRDMRDGAVENDAAGFVLIEALIDHVLEKPATLRRTEADRPARRLVLVVVEKRIVPGSVVAQK